MTSPRSQASGHNVVQLAFLGMSFTEGRQPKKLKRMAFSYLQSTESKAEQLHEDENVSGAVVREREL